MDGFSIAALIAFHGMMSFMVSNLVGMAVQQIDALAKDAESLEKGGGAAIVRVDLIQVGLPALVAMRAIFGISFILFVAYLLRMTM